MEIISERERLRELASLTLDLARQQRMTAEVSLSVDEGLSLKVRQGQADKVEFLRGQGVSLVVYHDGAKGSASTTDLSAASIRRVVESACAIARHTQKDPCAGLADAAEMATDFPDLDLFHPWALSVDDALTRALEGEEAALQYEGVDQCDAVSVSSSQALRVYANTHDLMVDQASSRHGFGCSVIAREGEAMHRDSYGVSERQHVCLPSITTVAAEAASRVNARRGARKIPTQRVPVLFRADIASGLIGSLVGALSGGALFRQASFLQGSLGTQILPDWFSLSEAPRLRGGFGSAVIDGDGLATRAQTLIDAGVVSQYVLGTYSARKLGMKSTANAGGLRNVRFPRQSEDWTSLLKRMGRGLVVTEVMGQGVNLVTGDYSRGAAGFWVEQGEICHAVREVTIAGNLRDMFRHLVVMGNDLDTRGNIHCGSLLLEEMMVAGA